MLQPNLSASLYKGLINTDNMRILLIFIMVASFQVMYGQQWLTDFEQATQLAKAENHKIVLVFQGSDWCAPCMKLDHEIWSSPEFVQYAEHHFILVKADFPRKKKNQLSGEQQQKNNQLAEKFNQEGFFPLVVVLAPDGKILGKTGYENVSPEEYINILEGRQKS